MNRRLNIRKNGGKSLDMKVNITDKANYILALKILRKSFRDLYDEIILNNFGFVRFLNRVEKGDYKNSELFKKYEIWVEGIETKHRVDTQNSDAPHKEKELVTKRR